MAAPTGSEEGQATFTRFMGGDGVDVPIVGATQATAVAGGFELLLNCDLAVVSEDAKLGLPEVKRALFAAGGGVYLSNRIPLAIALELTLTGDYIPAHDARTSSASSTRSCPRGRGAGGWHRDGRAPSPATARSRSRPAGRSCAWPTPTW